MPLMDVQIRTAKPTEGRTAKLSGGCGLQLWVTATGSKLWNVAYRDQGQQKKLSLGPYPRITLKDARDGLDAAKRVLASGADPGQQKKLTAIKKANAGAATFGVIADEFVICLTSVCRWKPRDFVSEPPSSSSRPSRLLKNALVSRLAA